MAKKPKRKPAPRKILAGILAAIGKPFYLFIINFILGIIIFLAFLGKSTRLIFEKLSRIKLPKIKVKFPNLGFKFRFGVKHLLVFVLVGFLFLLFYFLFFILHGLPSPEELITRNIDVSTKIYDRNGELLYKIYKDQDRTVVKLDKIPDSVRLATLAAEDAEFYFHPGISMRGIFRALVQNLKTGDIQGGSTITQQLVKNALLSPEKTLTRKLKEIILSLQVELNFTKNQILEMYLNEVSYGGTIYGIEAASEEYFGKKVDELNLAEAALLAGLPKSPTKYSPFGEDPNLAFIRQGEVLKLMRINGYITEAQEKEALNTTVKFIANKNSIKAPHFVMFVRSHLVDLYGEEMVAKGGLEVVTTLDMKIQELTEKIVKEEVQKLKNLRVGNGAALVINPKKGEILAMVGSKDYFNLEEDGNVNVTTRLRQPGSSIKVINYAYALSNSYTPSTILDDSPIAYRVPGQPLYSPKNYDGKYRGKITLRTALAESRNIPAVKVLASYGVNKMIEMGKAMGITTWTDSSRYGLSLTLGGGEVKLIDLAQAYATIANYGVRPEISPLLEIKDYNGKQIFNHRFNLDTKVLDERVAYQLIDILKDNQARSGAFGTNSYLVINNHPEVAVKTGTSNDLKDNLTIGFNQNFLVAVWVGNNDNSPMARIASGVTGASPIWNKILSSLMQSSPPTDWIIPNGLNKISCGTKIEWFLEEKIDPNYCRPIPNTKDNKEEEKVPQIL